MTIMFEMMDVCADELFVCKSASLSLDKTDLSHFLLRLALFFVSVLIIRSRESGMFFPLIVRQYSNSRKHVDRATAYGMDSKSAQKRDQD